jgi:peptide/nickel transport system permease protein/peptide/nickel transport system substrate-binding protein
MPKGQGQSNPRGKSAVTRRHALAITSGAMVAIASDRVSAQQSPKKGGTLRVSSGSNPSSLDPTTGGSGADHAFLYTMFDT